jgi:hypothetical protein
VHGAAAGHTRQRPPPSPAAPLSPGQAKAAFLRADLAHLFDDVGIDASAYAPVVDFQCAHAAASGAATTFSA